MGLDVIEAVIRDHNLEKLEEISNMFLGDSYTRLSELIRSTTDKDIEVRRYDDSSSRDGYLLVTVPKVIKLCGDAGKDFIWRMLCYWKSNSFRSVNMLLARLNRLPRLSCADEGPPGAIVGYDRDSRKYFVNQLTPYQAAAIAIGGPPRNYNDLLALMGFDRHYWEGGEPETGERVRVQGDIVARFLYVDSSERGENARDLAAWVAAVERAAREAPRAIVRFLRSVEEKLRSLSLDYSLPEVRGSLPEVLKSIVASEISKVRGSIRPRWSVSSAGVHIDTDTRIVNAVLGGFDALPFCVMRRFLESRALIDLCNSDDVIESCVKLLPSVLAEAVLARSRLSDLTCYKDRSVRALSTHSFIDRGWLVSISLGGPDGLYSRDFANLTRALAEKYFDEEARAPLGREEFTIGNHRVIAEPARLVRAPLTGLALMGREIEAALQELEDTIMCTNACCMSDKRRIKHRIIIDSRLGDDPSKRWAVAGALLGFGHAQMVDHLLLLGPGARMVMEHGEHGVVRLELERASLIAFESIP